MIKTNKLDPLDIALIAGFFVSLIAVVFAVQIGLTGEAFTVVKDVIITTLPAFLGKQIPSTLGIKNDIQ